MNKEKLSRRSEKAGVFNFAKEMISALLMAFVAIVYIIQAFKIPTGSMENSLLVGDFLLGLKFIYGAPVLPFVTDLKFPGITNPKPGDVVIFKYPGADKKDYIKRCIAGPGQTIEINKKKIFLDGVELKLPPNGIHIRDGLINEKITYFKKLRIPAKGDTIFPNTLPIREFLFLKHLIYQENPRKEVTVQYDLYIDSTLANNRPLIKFPYSSGNKLSFEQIIFDKIDDWVILSSIFDQLKNNLKEYQFEIRKAIFLDGKVVHQYIVKNNNYFMMGDNRDNSMDSRFWGYVNKNFVKAKAFILYFSLNKKVPYILLPLKIRWNRIGKLIRGWDGLDTD
ncbi:MAG: signal peptidase I [Chitinispirillia bacterium]